MRRERGGWRWWRGSRTRRKEEVEKVMAKSEVKWKEGAEKEAVEREKTWRELVERDKEKERGMETIARRSEKKGMEIERAREMQRQMVMWRVEKAKEMKEAEVKAKEIERLRGMRRDEEEWGERRMATLEEMVAAPPSVRGRPGAGVRVGSGLLARACVRACVRACARASVRACVRACMRSKSCSPHSESCSPRMFVRGRSF